MLLKHVYNQTSSNNTKKSLDVLLKWIGAHKILEITQM